MQRTVAEKMGIRAESRAYFKSAPVDALDAIDIPPIDIAETLNGSFDYIHLFTLSADDLSKQFPRLKKHLEPKGMLWVSWPKNKQLGTDLTIKEVIRIGYEAGLVESTCLSINATWSAIKFTFPKKGKIYKNSYGTLKVSIVLLFCLGYHFSVGQNAKPVSLQNLSVNSTAIIPFKLTASNNFTVPAVINKTDSVLLMFHTAANALTVTEEGMKKMTTLKFQGTDTVKSWGAGANNSRFSNHNLLQLANLSWSDLPIWENTNSGPGTDGKFGIDLFANRIIEINNDHSHIKIHSSIPSTKDFQKFDLVFENDMMFINADCLIGDSIITNKFLLHSGYSGSVLFDDVFAGAHDIDHKLTITGEKDLKDSFGNTIKTRKAMLPGFSIGKITLNNVPAGFFSGAIGRQKMSIIGGDILKRFNMIIDAERKHIYLQQSRLAGVDYLK